MKNLALFASDTVG